MFSKIYKPPLAIAIAHLLFILSINPTWAETYSDSVIIKSNDKFNERKVKLILVGKRNEMLNIVRILSTLKSVEYRHS